jgi:geranylgeranyl diphosphate synthase type I
MAAIGDDRLFGLFNAMCDSTMIGQMLDLKLRHHPQTQKETIERKDTFKTAYYSFIYPMLMGYTLTKDVSREKRNAIIRLGKKLGIAYQFQDDLMDIVSTISGKDRMQDIAEGEATQIVRHFLDNATEPQREHFFSLFGRPLAEEHKQTIYTLFEESGTLAWARAQAERSLKQTRVQIDETAHLFSPAIVQDMTFFIQTLDYRLS